MPSTEEEEAVRGLTAALNEPYEDYWRSLGKFIHRNARTSCCGSCAATGVERIH
jgi:hypothetical protein